MAGARDESSDDASDSDSDDEVSPEQLAQLQAAVAANPDDYNAHAALVEAYRKIGDFVKLRGAREAFSKRLPWPEGAPPSGLCPHAHTRCHGAACARPAPPVMQHAHGPRRL